MTATLPTDLLLGFLMAVLRASAWIVVAPPFSTRAIPAPVKIGLAVAISLPIAPQLVDSVPPLELGPLVVAMLTQVAAGLALGFVTLLLFSAIQAAGELLDVFVGYTIASTYDPFSNATTAVLGRFYYLLAVTLLFVLDGHLMLVHGFLDSFKAAPADADLLGALAGLLLDDLSTFFLAALQIAAPLLGALFLTEVAMGMLSRAAPQMNVFTLGFPVKILLALMLLGLTVPLLPGAVENVVTAAVRSMAGVARLFA